MRAQVAQAVVEWFAGAARPLPWRAAGVSPWAVLVSEVMSHQTPMSRVEPVWRAWMDRWPTPGALAQAPTAEVVLAWGSLGYPRRALRLQECARVVAARGMPQTEAGLLELPGVGPYTAAAVASFAFGESTVVLDVNVRRVLGRVFGGVSHPKPALSKREHAWARQFVPQVAHAEFNAGAMELGALVCTSRAPKCGGCPVARWCQWLAAGRPVDEAVKPKTQAWAGTDRQLRGAIMKALRLSAGGATGGAAGGADTAPPLRVDFFVTPTESFDDADLEVLQAQVAQAVARVRELGTSERIARLIDDLVSDGLAVQRDGALTLP